MTTPDRIAAEIFAEIDHPETMTLRPARDAVLYARDHMPELGVTRSNQFLVLESLMVLIRNHRKASR